MADDLAPANAYACKGETLLSLARWQEALAVYRQGLGSCWRDGRTHLQNTLLSPDGPLVAALLAKHWTQLILDAEKPNPLSPRDGKLLKLVSSEHRLDGSALCGCLGQLFQDLAWLSQAARDLLVAAWLQGRNPGRAARALMRGHAYLHKQLLDVALRDAKLGLAYAPKQNGECSWPAVHALHSAILEAQVQNTQAALAMQKAQALQPAPHQEEALERLMRRIPESHATALKEKGAAGLTALLADEEEEAKPEFLKQRPKYYYYNQWMRQRLAAACPALPEPVVEKMLEMEAGELDLILQYPQAAGAQATQVLECYEAEGAEAFKAKDAPQLTWDQVKALKGQEIVGLGMGGLAPGEKPQQVAAPPQRMLLQQSEPGVVPQQPMMLTAASASDLDSSQALPAAVMQDA